jgi:hypothetical protein
MANLERSGLVSMMCWIAHPTRQHNWVGWETGVKKTAHNRIPDIDGLYNPRRVHVYVAQHIVARDIVKVVLDEMRNWHMSLFGGVKRH